MLSAVMISALGCKFKMLVIEPDYYKKKLRLNLLKVKTSLQLSFTPVYLRLTKSKKDE